MISWALNEDKMTLLHLELSRRAEGSDVREPLNDTTYVPKAEDVKELAMLERNFGIAEATVDLYGALLWGSACESDRRISAARAPFLLSGSSISSEFSPHSVRRSRSTL